MQKLKSANKDALSATISVAIANNFDDNSCINIRNAINCSTVESECKTTGQFQNT
jgi:hypothetical protein